MFGEVLAGGRHVGGVPLARLGLAEEEDGLAEHAEQQRPELLHRVDAFQLTTPAAGGRRHPVKVAAVKRQLVLALTD